MISSLAEPAPFLKAARPPFPVAPEIDGRISGSIAAGGRIERHGNAAVLRCRDRIATRIRLREIARNRNRRSWQRRSPKFPMGSNWVELVVPTVWFAKTSRTGKYRALALPDSGDLRQKTVRYQKRRGSRAPGVAGVALWLLKYRHFPRDLERCPPEIVGSH